MMTLVVSFKGEMMEKSDTIREGRHRKEESWENSETARHQERGDDLLCQKKETVIAEILALSYSCHNENYFRFRRMTFKRLLF